MYKFFVKTNQIEENRITIDSEDVNHIKNVLRLGISERIEISNSDIGEGFICEIVKYENNTVICEIIEKIEDKSETKIHLNIFQGLPKSDKMELIIQKGTELGVKEFTPVALNRCIVKLNGKDEAKKYYSKSKFSY